MISEREETSSRVIGTTGSETSPVEDDPARRKPQPVFSEMVEDGEPSSSR